MPPLTPLEQFKATAVKEVAEFLAPLYQELHKKGLFRKQPPHYPPFGLIV